jgi:hypothetical protein
VQSLDDFGSWYFKADGEPLRIEGPLEPARMPKSERLAPARVEEAFRAYTGLALPKWK